MNVSELPPQAQIADGDEYYVHIVDALDAAQIGKWTARDLNNLVGTKVKLSQDWDVMWPHNGRIFKVGETGVIIRNNNDGCIYVKLDEYEPDLDDWDNEIQVQIDGATPQHAMAMLLFYWEPIQ